ncbi:MAG TPA: HAD family hydrolase [Methylophilaceae bacterium]|nr:HAD family hydrolase [Methylophilaceae bacterium]
MNLNQYRTLVFDCDGVILESNELKTQAYYDTAISFGASHEQAQALVEYHVRLGGISRFVKFDYFLQTILGKPLTDEDMQYLLQRFAEEIHKGLLNCAMAPRLAELRQATSDARWMVISGGDQAELRALFVERGIADMFDAGIFGSPDNKDQILKRELGNGNLPHPALFLGDSRYDHEASMRAGLDFLFVSEWTEVEDWQEFCRVNNIKAVERLENLL